MKRTRVASVDGVVWPNAVSGQHAHGR